MVENETPFRASHFPAQAEVGRDLTSEGGNVGFAVGNTLAASRRR